MQGIAQADGDKVAVSGDLNLMGNILLEAGRIDEAAARFAKSVAVSDQADAPPEVKEAARRNALFDQARVALARNDAATARARSKAYAEKVAVGKVPFEVRRSHEIAGLIALQAKDYPIAIAELKQANQQDPKVLYNLARAYRGQGEAALARQTFQKAADFNGLGFNYAYVRTKAQKALAEA